MLLWLLLLLLILAISFVLARLSMKDYTEIPPSGDSYGLYLIRQPARFDQNFLNQIQNELKKLSSIISFERLFKGKEAALVVFGPKKLLMKFSDMLNLLELEDYANVSEENGSVWEIGIKQNEGSNEFSLDKSIHNLLEDEQLWWQLILSKAFKSQIRVVLVSKDPAKRQDISQVLNLPANLLKLPKVYSTTQLLDFYQKRSFQINEDNPVLNPQQILKLLWIL